MMNGLTKLFSSSLGKKLIMAMTGLFLFLFLVVHLAGNFQLLNNDGGQAFNLYAAFMGTNPVIQTVSKINFLIVFIHMAMAIILTKTNQDARGPVAYKMTNEKSSGWASRHMFFVGTIILLFILIHLRHFWVETHFGSIPTVTYAGKIVPNLYAVAAYWFSKTWYVSLYVFCMIAVAFHFWHGITSAMQTLGINHIRYNLGILVFGKSLAVILPSLFAYIPVMMYLTTVSHK